MHTTLRRYTHLLINTTHRNIQTIPSYAFGVHILSGKTSLVLLDAIIPLGILNIGVQLYPTPRLVGMWQYYTATGISREALNIERNCLNLLITSNRLLGVDKNEQNIF